MDRFLSREIRVWVYGVTVVAMPLLVFYGVVEQSAAPLWIAAAGGVLVPGLALANVPPKGQTPLTPPDDQDPAG
jgi:hypothetical protein